MFALILLGSVAAALLVRSVFSCKKKDDRLPLEQDIDYVTKLLKSRNVPVEEVDIDNMDYDELVEYHEMLNYGLQTNNTGILLTKIYNDLNKCNFTQERIYNFVIKNYDLFEDLHFHTINFTIDDTYTLFANFAATTQVEEVTILPSNHQINKAWETVTKILTLLRKESQREEDILDEEQEDMLASKILTPKEQKNIILHEASEGSIRLS